MKILNDGSRFEAIQQIVQRYRNNDAIIVLPQKNVADYQMWHEEFVLQLDGTDIFIYIMDFQLSEETKKFATENNIQLI